MITPVGHHRNPSVLQEGFTVFFPFVLVDNSHCFNQIV